MGYVVPLLTQYPIMHYLFEALTCERFPQTSYEKESMNISPTQVKLQSPVGQYCPQVLMLAPEKGDDPNCLSLVSQFLEMGVPIELDENWRLPTSPPRDLSFYKACIFPESSREKYDAELDAFSAAGGYVPYFRYYPDEDDASAWNIHGYMKTYGRDDYFFHAANTVAEGASTGDADFRQALRARSVKNIVTDYRETIALPWVRKAQFVNEAFTSWGDPTYTFVLGNYYLARTIGDAEWLQQLDCLMEIICDAVPEALRNPLKFQEVQLKGIIDICPALISSLLIKRGVELSSSRLMETGVKLAHFYVSHQGEVDGVFRETWMRLWWSESMGPMLPLSWLGRMAGEKKYWQQAEKLLQHCGDLTQREDGLWHHWVSDAGDRCGATWSRAQMWPMVWMIDSIQAYEPSSAMVEAILKRVHRTFKALRKHQDRDSGMWHLVVDEPFTRPESSATACLVYCHDYLRELELIGDEYQEMFDRAFLGLKEIYYAGGLASTCRGTATGNAHYYRTRPMGFYANSLFPAGLATRC